MGEAMKNFTSPKSMKTSILAAAMVAGAMAFSMPAHAAGNGPAIHAQKWSFSGPFGMFDRGQLQRGYKVYKEVCASCHAMRFLHFRNLSESGGPEFPKAAVKVLAAEAEVQDGPDDDGEMFTRPGRPSDKFPSPFANEQEARSANNGAYPPDLSIMAKARKGGADYLYALMVGYGDAPAGMKMSEGMNYNKAFPGHQIAMPEPISAELVDYTDGTAPTLENYAKDVSAFLMWAAEPKLEERHKIGFRFMIYLALLAGLLYFAKRRVWSKLEH